MLKKSMTQLFVLVLAFTLVLTACGANNVGNGNTGNKNEGTTPESTTPAKEEAKQVEFTIGYATGDPATKKAVADSIKAFTDANPNIKIVDVSEGTSSSYLDWLKTKDAVGEFPDLVEMRDTEIFAKAGKIAELPSDLTDLFSKTPEVNGKVYNAPITFNAPQGIIYSKKAYANAGITELPKTYGEFLEAQEKLKATGITPIVVGGKDIFHMGFWLNKFLIDEVYVKDGDWNSKRTAKTVSFTDAGPVQAMTDYKELFTKYVDKGWLSTADNQTASILVSGKAAQLFSGPWMFTQIKEADPSFEFGYYALPDRAGGINVIGLPSPAGWTLSAEAAKDADKTEAMKSFIRFFFSKEQYSQYLKAANGIPSTKEEVIYEATEQMQEVLKIMADPNVKKSLAINNWWGENQIPPQFRNWFYKLMQDLVLKDGNVAEYMGKADVEYDTQVKANKQ
ncbi:ABC transporter substrate-binding protein [Paenibacillus prosopidis]|uniref:Raffinose/stachyose/melibiose transport system substrate-binding protein n=1 Tax=Paenibacillus prosopidis TaxID=630520 RepID=A0A368VLX0_9BACL|nr:extracellular solute-binding protein [Paenibacillus prosopidis]RCW42510.1 raffinose/stachyose/melibiose transport system substrate-binding protein [Paenibacillus prosopidis]